MITIDFNVPTYLRASRGLAILSPLNQHLLPGEDEQTQEQPLEPVVINRLYGGRKPTCWEPEPEEVRGELIPFKDPVNEDSEPASESDYAELSFGGIKGKSVTGVYGGSGYAHYRFNKKNGKSFYLRIGKHLIWGVELGPEVRRCGVQQGQKISVTFMGKQPVTVLKKTTVDGQPTEEWITTNKNLWEVKRI